MILVATLIALVVVSRLWSCGCSSGKVLIRRGGSGEGSHTANLTHAWR